MQPWALLVLVACAVVLTAAGCSNGNEPAPYTNPRWDYMSKYGRNQDSVFGEGGLSLSLFGKGDKDAGPGGSGIGVNSYLWRASLDMLFAPRLASAPKGSRERIEEAVKSHFSGVAVEGVCPLHLHAKIVSGEIS